MALTINEQGGVHFWRIVRAIAAKELLQILRDRLTAALVIGVPLAQILLFGYAIELAPMHWPTAWVSAAPADALQARAEKRATDQGWFDIKRRTSSLDEAKHWMQRGDVRFIVVWPADAAQRLALGESTEVQLLADLSDPFAAAAVNAVDRTLAARGGVAAPARAGRLSVTVEALYAARHGAGEYLVPALVGVILTLTLTLLSALSIVREVERGTWAGLLTSPAGAAAIVLGKLVTYFVVGLLLFAALARLAATLFGAAADGWALWPVAALFMTANLGLGLSISLLARTQMQAMQMGVFFYLPSILLSGFMFPFHAMPAWARAIGDALPLTHFLRCLRASLIRGADAGTVLGLAWPIALFAVAALLVAIWMAYRRI
jgi:ABC-2 type transport system permease protein